MKKYILKSYINPMIMLTIIGTLIGSAFAMGLQGVAYSFMLAVVFGVLEGIKIKAVTEKPQNKYGHE